MEEKQSKNTPQNERRFINQAKRFIRQAGIAVKNFRMFGDGHPVLVGNMQNLRDLLAETLAHRESITYTFLGDTLLVEDVRLKELDRKEYTLISELDDCGITSLSFQQGITEEELRLLFHAIANWSGTSENENGLADLFKKKNISHIKVDETFFKRVSKKDEEAKEAKGKLADILIMDYLSGKTSFSGDDRTSFTEEVHNNPAKIGRLISKNALAAHGITTPGGPENTPAGCACAAIEKLTSDMKNTGKDAKEIAVDIGNIISSLDPSLRIPVLKRAVSSSEDMPAMKSILDNFSDRVIIKIISSDVIDKGESITEMRQVIRKLLGDEEQRERVIPMLEKELLQKGIPQKTCSLLLEGKFWIDMLDDEKIRSIQAHPPAYPLELGLKEEILPLIQDLLSEKDFESVLMIISKLLNNLLSEDEDLKMRFMRDFHELGALVFRDNEYPYKRRFLNRLWEEYRNVSGKELRERFSSLFIMLLKISVEEKWYANLPFLIHAAGYDTVRAEIFRDGALKPFIEELLSDKKIDRPVIEATIRAIGDDAQKALCEMLLSLKTDDFDSYRKRLEIAGIAQATGNFIEGFFDEKLSSSDLDTVKISLEILSETGTEASVPFLNELLEHKDRHICDHAKIVLADIQKRRSSA